MSRPPLRFDWTVSLGNLISIGTVLVVGAIAWATLRGDVDDHAAQLTRLEAAVESKAGTERVARTEARIDLALERLAAKDVILADLTARFGSLERLMEEVRGELRTLNRRPAP